MSARIINFPSNRVSPAIIPFCGYSPEIQNIEFKDNFSVFQKDKDYSDKDFDEIIEDEELAKEMFPPDYFMLVE